MRVVGIAQVLVGFGVFLFGLLRATGTSTPKLVQTMIIWCSTLALASLVLLSSKVSASCSTHSMLVSNYTRCVNNVCNAVMTAEVSLPVTSNSRSCLNSGNDTLEVGIISATWNYPVTNVYRTFDFITNTTTECWCDGVFRDRNYCSETSLVAHHNHNRQAYGHGYLEREGLPTGCSLLSKTAQYCSLVDFQPTSSFLVGEIGEPTLDIIISMSLPYATKTISWDGKTTLEAAHGNFQLRVPPLNVAGHTVKKFFLKDESDGDVRLVDQANKPEEWDIQKPGWFRLEGRNTISDKSVELFMNNMIGTVTNCPKNGVYFTTPMNSLRKTYELAQSIYDISSEFFYVFNGNQMVSHDILTSPGQDYQNPNAIEYTLTVRKPKYDGGVIYWGDSVPLVSRPDGLLVYNKLYTRNEPYWMVQEDGLVLCVWNGGWYSSGLYPTNTTQPCLNPLAQTERTTPIIVYSSGYGVANPEDRVFLELRFDGSMTVPLFPDTGIEIKRLETKLGGIPMFVTSQGTIEVKEATCKPVISSLKITNHDLYATIISDTACELFIFSNSSSSMNSFYATVTAGSNLIIGELVDYNITTTLKISVCSGGVCDSKNVNYDNHKKVQFEFPATSWTLEEVVGAVTPSFLNPYLYVSEQQSLVWKVLLASYFAVLLLGLLLALVVKMLLPWPVFMIYIFMYLIYAAPFSLIGLLFYSLYHLFKRCARKRPRVKLQTKKMTQVIVKPKLKVKAKKPVGAKPKVKKVKKE